MFARFDKGYRLQNVKPTFFGSSQKHQFLNIFNILYCFGTFQRQKTNETNTFISNSLTGLNFKTV